MKEYEVKVKTVTTVYIEAEDREDAVKRACIEAMTVAPDEIDAVIADINGWFPFVIEGGKNIRMSFFTGCGIDEQWTLDDCERKCPKYYGCCAVAEANDALREYEEANL